ncbi:GNAT family N-acetyltransferase [Arthrobacter sp. MA-N2]|uniref:GNAT family N-acetyltransferase n=1 Tax=Arthrobacter sp. MA-N2 TaxID=1101188 RepID=UPI0004B3D42B|nr:GNAT family protein [Arthrobacter sp. MA-N2]
MQHDLALTRHGISLVPLSPDHAGPLFDFVDPGLWSGMAAEQPLSASELAELFAARLADPDTIPFAVVEQRTGALLGTTSLYEYSPRQQRLEIGGTFYGRPFWGSHVNPAAKQLLLAYSFDELAVHRVAFRCDARNTRSASAIQRLGASYEGTLRGHRFAPDGTRCDTAVFSILHEEWPRVREALLRRLAPFEMSDNRCAYIAEPVQPEHAA